MKKAFLTLAALSAFAGLASASVTYTVTGAYTLFNGAAASGTTESFTSGSDTFSLSYTQGLGVSPNTVLNFPSNESYGTFTLACVGTCDGTVVTFPAFVFTITINDMTDVGTGVFTGTSSGGGVAFNTGTNAGSSQVSIAWSPTQLGSGTNNAATGTFGTTFFTIETTTPIVDPSTNGGAQTVSGTVNSTAVPEPATLGMLGAGLLGLGFIARKRKA